MALTARAADYGKRIEKEISSKRWWEIKMGMIGGGKNAGVYLFIAPIWTD
jgi:hypothetical protein